MIPFLLTLRRIVRGIWRSLHDPEFQVLFSLASFTVLTGTWFYAQFEGLRWLDAFYFSVITLTTIGYGDFAPETDIGKVFTIFYVITGVGIMVGFVTTIFDHLQEARMNEVEAKRKKPPSS